MRESLHPQLSLDDIVSQAIKSVVDEKELQTNSFRMNEVKKLGKDILKISSEDAFKHVYDAFSAQLVSMLRKLVQSCMIYRSCAAK